MNRMKILAQGILMIGLAWGNGGCQTSLSPNATAGPISTEIPVDLAVARPGTLGSRVTFTGTTRPNQDVVLRAQVEGQVLSLGVDVGDRVAQGQVLARLDAALLRAAVLEAESELAARRSEVVQAKAQVNNAQIAVEQARLNLEQAQADAARFKQLLASGAIAAQTAEQAETTARTQRQVLASTQAQVQTAQEGVAIAQGRVQAQAAIVKQAQARLQYALIRSPLNGVVLERLTETGNLVQPGNELLRIGNLSQLRVVVELSEREAADLRVGQSAQITLDAAPNETLFGRVSQISPAAEATARLVPVEILINNPQQRFGSGQLARVTFQGETQARIVVPQSALAGEEEGNVSAKEGQVYVVKNNQVEVRAVELGNRRNGQVEIVTGLNPGERYVVRSGRPLKSGDTVRVSVLSES